MNAAAEFPIPGSLVEALAGARRIVAMTGAGVSAESDIPTFRDAMTGLWARFRPEDLATPEAFARNPKLVWDWYQWRRELVAAAKPNPGHHALVDMAALFPDFLLVTQNVDGLHQRAGSRDVVELHGNIAKIKRVGDGATVESWADPDDGQSPRCAETGALLRPDVVWFGEALPRQALARAAEAAAGCDAFFSIGTSAMVYPAAALIYEAMGAGAITVEVNPNATAQSAEVSFSLQGPAGSVLPALAQALKRRLGR